MLRDWIFAALARGRRVSALGTMVLVVVFALPVQAQPTVTQFYLDGVQRLCSGSESPVVNGVFSCMYPQSNAAAVCAHWQGISLQESAYAPSGPVVVHNTAANPPHGQCVRTCPNGACNYALNIVSRTVVTTPGAGQAPDGTSYGLAACDTCTPPGGPAFPTPQEVCPYWQAVSTTEFWYPQSGPTTMSYMNPDASNPYGWCNRESAANGFPDYTMTIVCRSGNCVQDTVSVSGPGSAESGGEPITLTVTLTRKPVFPKLGANIYVTPDADAVGSFSASSGTTDSNGQIRIVYTPPAGVAQSSVAKVRVTCEYCVNTVVHAIDVAGPDPGTDLSGGSLPTLASDGPGMCTRHPILPATGVKVFTQTDWIDQAAHPLSFVRRYASGWTRSPAGQLGGAWSHNFAHRVAGLEAAGQRTVVFGDGRVARFVAAGPMGSPWTAVSGRDTMVDVAQGIQVTLASDASSWLFSASDGRILSATSANGWTYQFTYSGDRLVQVTNAFGRALTLTYHSGGQLAGVNAPDGQQIAYGYDASGRLSTVLYPGAGSRSYVYEDARWPNALTGIFDEAGVRLQNVSYDALGRATLSELAGSADRNTVSYGSNGAAITDALGYTRSYQYVRVQGAAGGFRSTQASAPSPDGNTVSAQQFNAEGLLQSQTDFLGISKLFTWDAQRALPLTQTEAAGQPEQRVTTTEWHTSLPLPVRVTEPGRVTQWTYDAHGNPLSRSIADTSGSVTRTWAWTYNAQGLNTTATEPGGGVWQYMYDAAGNVTAETNPVGHVTSYTYDAAGRVLTLTGPNGRLTNFAYDLRGRLLTVSNAGLVSSFTYDTRGLVATAAFPDGRSFTYNYDNAHRLVGWTDNRGAEAVYTLDNAGNIRGEQVRPIGGAAVWQVARNLNEMQQVTQKLAGGAYGANFEYDANGSLRADVPLSGPRYTYARDALRRITGITYAGATASLTYDALDGITQAIDYKGVSTTYGRTVFGEATAETSPDAGSRSTAYNALGLPTSVVDALGQATQIGRDAIGRPTSLTFQDGHVTHLRYDLSGTAYNEGAGTASVGYLSEVEDRSGVTRWRRDVHGRVTRKVQTLRNGAAHTTSYGYNAQGLLDTLTYPSGAVLQHLYDATGRLTGMSWNGAPLISDISWNAAGQPLGWNWAFNNVAATRTWNTAGLLTANEMTRFVWTGAGHFYELYQMLGWPSDSNPTSTSVTFREEWVNTAMQGLPRPERIDRYAAWSTTYNYDANGNPVSMARQIYNGPLIQRNYSVDATSNRLLGFSQTITAGGGTVSASVAYAYNANGDLLSDGLAQYAYDAEGRLSSVTIGNTATSPTTRYAHNALGQRVFKTEPVYPALGEDAQEEGFWASLAAFFKALWNPFTSPPEQLGWAFVYDEDGNLIGEYGSGGAQSTGSTQHVWLPTPNGPVPVVAIVNGVKYSVHADHLNTPRRLTNEAGHVAWQWTYSHFGDDKPTTAYNRFVDPETQPGYGHGAVADVKFNLRYPGQYHDEESGLNYNYFRSYDSRTGRYTQPDPIGLKGDWNRFAYARSNSFAFVDPLGLDALIPGGRPSDRRVYEAGQACTVSNIPVQLFIPPAITSAGCIVEEGATICFGPGMISSNGAKLAQLSKEQLKAMIGPAQTRLFQELFGTGLSGAQAAQNATRPAGLTNEAVAAYRELANRAIARYEQSGNAAGAEVQRMRVEILNRLSR